MKRTAARVGCGRVLRGAITCEHGRVLHGRLVTCVGLVACLALAACGDDGSRSAGADPDAASVDPEALLGGSWEPPAQPDLADPIIAEDCGDPFSTVRGSVDGLQGRAVSPVLAPAPDDEGRSFGEVRVAVAVFATIERAAATDDATAAVQAECVRAAVTRYLAMRDAGDGEDVAPPTIDAFPTRGGPGGGTNATVTLTRFDEDVLGGFDNLHDVASARARSGSVVASALVASNSQNGDAARTVAMARRLAEAALRRATR